MPPPHRRSGVTTSSAAAGAWAGPASAPVAGAAASSGGVPSSVAQALGRRDAICRALLSLLSSIDEADHDEVRLSGERHMTIWNMIWNPRERPGNGLSRGNDCLLPAGKVAPA